MLVLFQVVAIALVLIIAVRRPQLGYKWFRAAWREVGRIVRRPALSVVLVGLLGLMVNAGASLLVHMPKSHIQDEFSYLLAADTFAHGRLTNPTPRCEISLSRVSISSTGQPMQSKYPPAGVDPGGGAGASVGHPILGVWISIGLACAAMYWMLQAGCRRDGRYWGVRRGIASGIVLRWGPLLGWGCGSDRRGASLLGALRRIMLRPRYGTLADGTGPDDSGKQPTIRG